MTSFHPGNKVEGVDEVDDVEDDEDEEDEEDDKKSGGDDDDDGEEDEEDEDDDEDEEETWQVSTLTQVSAFGVGLRLTSGSELPKLAPISRHF